MRVRLVRRWGSTPAGESVDVDATQGRWLIDHAFGVAVAEPAPAQAAAAPAEAGSESPASGEPSGESTPPAGQPVRVRRRRKASPES